MSKNYNKVKSYWDRKLWDETRVRNAVEKGWITEEEFEEITNISYLPVEEPTEEQPEETEPTAEETEQPEPQEETSGEEQPEELTENADNI